MGNKQIQKEEKQPREITFEKKSNMELPRDVVDALEAGYSNGVKDNELDLSFALVLHFLFLVLAINNLSF